MDLVQRNKFAMDCYSGRARILPKITHSELLFEEASWESACERAPKRFYTLLRASLLSHSGLSSWLLNWLAKGLYSLMSDFHKDPSLTSRRGVCTSVCEK